MSVQQNKKDLEELERIDYLIKEDLKKLKDRMDECL